ncbi:MULTISPECIES: S1 family peptidase [Nocardia]|uniref:Alpha-lytic protease n=2 Tax=Nocardia farcinica TaxID=37329 RepID=A0A449H597_NOCFR|nr:MULTISPECIES: S1 family peptidase [Nocardia]MBF6186753.1 protease [Nocardia farcinica]MBF6232265.1 protease [Nocardia farcinica]MBF6247917.1 protease [Nocardia elegans]MBF6255014.1 protease [Nocardia farcinica]MBF6269084.1 protease [Nocardia farcinica]
MRKLVARRAAVRAASLGVAATVLLAPLSGTATADPVPGQLSADSLPAELVEAIARDLKMTPTEYLDRAARAQQLRDYAQDFRAERPDDFAGAWMGADGKPVVAVTSADAARIAAADGYQTHLAPVSADSLESSLTQLAHWMNSLPRELSQAVNSVAIDFLNSQLIVSVANTPAGHMLNLPTLIANIKVILSPDSGGPVERRPMGGDTYISAPTSLQDESLRGVDVCSFGFNSVDAAGNALNISAGHCDPNIDKSDERASVYLPNVQDIANSPELGSFVRAELGGPSALDYSVIQLNERAVRGGMDRPIVRGANGTTLTITGVADPITGAPVCKSGQSSTFTCGFVVADRVETQLYTANGESRTIRGFASSACTLGGDSGGAIVSGTLALGITSGSNAADAPNCNEANVALAPYGGTATLGIPIRAILADIDATSGGGVGSGIQVRTGGHAG